MRMSAWRVPGRFVISLPTMVPIGLFALAPAHFAGCYFPVGLDDCHPLQHGSFGRPPRAVHNFSDVLAEPARRESVLLLGGNLGFSGAAVAELARGERITGRSIIAAHCVRPPDRAIAVDNATAPGPGMGASLLLGSSAAAAAVQLQVERFLWRAAVEFGCVQPSDSDVAGVLVAELARDLAGAAAIVPSEVRLIGSAVVGQLDCERASANTDSEHADRHQDAGRVDRFRVPPSMGRRRTDVCMAGERGAGTECLATEAETSALETSAGLLGDPRLSN